MNRSRRRTVVIARPHGGSIRSHSGPGRRHFLYTAFTGMAGLLAPPAVGAGRRQAADALLQVDVPVDAKEAEQILALLKDVGAQKPEKLVSRGLSDVETILVAGLVASTFSALISRLLRFWKCGVTVDARRSRVQTERSCDLMAGTVLIVKPDGSQQRLQNPSDRELTAAISSMRR